MTVVRFHTSLHPLPAIGILTGLFYLQCVGDCLKETHRKEIRHPPGEPQDSVACDFRNKVARAERDRPLLLRGLVPCAGGSLLSIGPAAGVTAMGLARAANTPFSAA